MRSLLADAEQHGATLGLRSPVLSLERSGGSFVLQIGGDEPTVLSCRLLVIAAGHGASELTRTLAEVPGACVPDTLWAKGNYFSLSGKSPFGRLVYPVPEPGGLGVHLTLDLGGQARFGPDVEWTENFDYAVDPQRGDCFYEAIRRYWPGLPGGSLAPAYAGIRPKISRPGEKDADFLVLGPLQHGVAGMVSLFGIESPGLTASLAIAEHVCALLKD
jgi:L-2-hydroxyglutarate oxidase LhgO